MHLKFVIEINGKMLQFSCKYNAIAVYIKLHKEL